MHVRRWIRNSVAGLGLAAAGAPLSAAEPTPEPTTAPLPTVPTVGIPAATNANPPIQAVPYSSGPCLPGTPGYPTYPWMPGPGAPGAQGVPPGAQGAPDPGTMAAADRGTGESRGFNPTMFGDAPAAFTPNPLTATVNGQPFNLVRGQPIPPSLIQPGTTFNFDIFLSNGTIIPAGSALTSSDVSAVSALGPLPGFQGSSSSSNSYGSIRAAAVIALVSRGSFKITENESPRPMTRVYGLYNYFNNVGGSGGSGGQDVHREVAGFEYAFLDGKASFGIRVPTIQTTGGPGVAKSGFGDLTFIGKYAFINNAETGNVASIGLSVTAPTGANFVPRTLVPRSTLFQPWVGGIYNAGNLYVQGFSSFLFPTARNDFTFMFNDIGIGYFVIRNGTGLITYLAPTFEVHVTTPLNHRNATGGYLDIVDFMYGVSTGIGSRAFLNLGVGHPVSGPQPFNVEALCQLNYRF